MSQRLQKKNANGVSSGSTSDERGDTVQRSPRAGVGAAVAAGGTDDGMQIAYGPPADVLPSAHSVQYILFMVHDLKKLAAKAGLQRVALILEMAELEARDQVRKPAR